MARQRIELTPGAVFGRGTVLEEIRMPKSDLQKAKGWQGSRGARLRCECGNIYESSVPNLKRTRSCGCLFPEIMSTRPHPLKTHGLTNHELYGTHAMMLYRCYNSESISYPWYGAKGVKVHDDWHEVTNFIAWIESNIGPRPVGCTLDRIDPYGDYEPGNVRWATKSEQSSNQRGA